MFDQTKKEVKAYIDGWKIRWFNFFDNKRKIEVLENCNWYKTFTGWADSHAMKYISFKELRRLSLEDINHIVRNELTDTEIKERDAIKADIARCRAILEEWEIKNGLISEPYK